MNISQYQLEIIKANEMIKSNKALIKFCKAQIANELYTMKKIANELYDMET
jgi:hypothetical protein